jgi:hypothetical protein
MSPPGIEDRVDVLEVRQVAAHGDEVQILVVLGPVTGHWCAARAEDLEPHRHPRHSGNGPVGQHQGVAVLGHHEPTRHRRRTGRGRHCHRTHAQGVLGE